METKAIMAFRVKDKGGPAGGKNLSAEYPEFDFEQFIKTGNAPAFVEKMYLASVKKIIREIDENKNGTVDADLTSYEAIVTRSLSFTKAEIVEWLDTRDWSQISVSEGKNPDDAIKQARKFLPLLASRRRRFEDEYANRFAYQVVATVADKPDPIAEFLFSTLTSPPRRDSEVEDPL